MPDNGLPFARPSKIVCVGLNYRDHARVGHGAPERAAALRKCAELADRPRRADRAPGAGDGGRLRGRARRRDRPRRRASVAGADALDHVAGYTVANDVRARDRQFARRHSGCAARLRHVRPGRPVVTADEVPDPQALAIRCRLNGETMQDSHDRADGLHASPR